MGRKKLPPVTRPTGKERLIELGKDLLILALACSAAFLAWQTPMASRFRGWVARPEQAETPPALQGGELLTPYTVAARNSLGLYGVSYDEAGVERAFGRLGPFFGEALSTAATPRSLTGTEWQARLDLPGAYCQFQGALPLDLLAGWLEEDEEGTTFLTGQAEALLLSWDGDQVELCWRQGEDHYAARTGLVYEGYLESALEEFSPNGAAYAGTLTETVDAYGLLAPDVLVGMSAPQPFSCTGTTPELLGDSGMLEQLMAALNIQSGATYTDASGGLAVNEGGDRFRISPTGIITFYAGEEPRYHVPGAEGPASAGEAALAAGDLLQRVSAPWRGEAGYVLTGVEPLGQGWRITFHARLAGIPVTMGETGWCAQFTVSDRQVTSFTIQLRSYTTARTISVVPPERLAAAALASLPESSGRLMLTYTDTGSNTLTAGWVVRD